MATKTESQQSCGRTTQTETGDTLREETQHLRDENRLLRRKLDLVRRVEYLPDCEVFNDLPHDVWSEILEHHFKKRELAVLAFVNKSWAQRTREILELRRPLERLFRIPNISKGMKPWRSRKWQFQGAKWYHEVTFEADRRDTLHYYLCRELGQGHSDSVPIYVQATHRLINRICTNYVRCDCGEERYSAGSNGWGFCTELIKGEFENPRNGWIQNGYAEIELQMKVMTEAQFFKKNPNYEVN